MTTFQTESGVYRVDESKREEQQKWIQANRRRYGGLYVALDGSQLLGTGKNYAEAADAAAREVGKPERLSISFRRKTTLGKLDPYYVFLTIDLRLVL